MKAKLVSVLKGAAIAAGGAALAYLGQWASGADLGAYGPAASAALAIVVNLLRKLVESQAQEPQEPSDPDDGPTSYRIVA